MNNPPRNSTHLLSIVVPVFNEQAVLSSFYDRLQAILGEIDETTEIVFVNDGSRDDSLNILHDLRDRDSRICIINLSRNFGKDNAITAGLDHCLGEAAIIIDADLQDPPELIPTLIAEWYKGYDIVYATRASRNKDTFLKRQTATWFYRVMRRLTSVDIPADTGDYRLLSRRAVNSLTGLRERHRFMKGLFAWIGYPSTSVIYQRDQRAAGETKWSYWALWNYAIEGFTSFTTAPLKIATYFGLLTAIMSFVYALWIIYKTLRFGEPVTGYPSLMVVILMLGGVQLMTLGVIGEYLGRAFNESKQRPLYIVEQLHPSFAKNNTRE